MVRALQSAGGMRTAVLVAASLAILVGGCRRRACRSDGDCMDGTVCRTSTGACIVPECTTADDCASGACLDRMCVACSTDDDCGPSGEMVCDPEDQDCVARECEESADCDAGLSCRGGLCRPCTYDGDCATGDACHHGACVDRECGPGAELPCAGDLVCDEGRCLPCSDTLACPEHEGCIDGRCHPCTEDAQCGPGRVCLEGECWSTCSTPSDCADDHVLGCRGRGQAIACGEIFCAADRQTGYPQSSVCDPCLASIGGCPSGTCNERRVCECASDDECPGALRCRGGLCLGCTTDAHCGCDAFCAAGECHDRCTADSDCEGGDRCLVSTGRCVPCLTDADCGSGETCYEDGCSGRCDRGGLFPCAPFVPCGGNGRCGFCDQCGVGPESAAIGSCS